jgi:hypothetical protein
MISRIKSMLGVCALGVCAFGGNVAFAVTMCPDTSAYPLNGCALGGDLVAGSFPYFEQSVYVTLHNRKNGSFSLNATYGGVADATSDFLVNNTGGLYPIDNTFYQLKAKYNSNKDELTGTIRIMGTIDGQPSRQTLMTADLTGVWDSSGALIGFNTMNIQCGSAITAIVPCTLNEVVYLTNISTPLSPGEGKGRTSATGLAVTSVPLPAAAWLFGSGLLGLVVVSRRSRRAV